MTLRLLAYSLLIASASLSGRSDTIELLNGKTHTGALSGRVASFVSLRLDESQGKVELRFAPEEIARIQFADSATPPSAGASTPALERLVRARLPYIDLLEASDESLFVQFLESLIESGRFQDALDRSKLWRTKLRSPARLSKIEELQIVAAWNLGSQEEAAFYSKRWVDDGKPARETALPWVVLAEMALNENRVEDAHWLALNPIVFSYPDTPRFLERAYEVAVFSAYQLGHVRTASELYSDMRDRTLAWPIGSERSHIVAQLSSATDAETDSPIAPPASSRSLNKVAGSP